MRIRRQIQQNVFAHERRQIDHLGTGEIRVESEIRHFESS